MSASISRFLLPRGYITPYSHSSKFVNSPQVVYRTFPSCRNASASTSKPLVLEKPTRFNPPSHGKRLKEQVPRQYGPQLTQNQKVEQQTKKYPNMMPPRGTWMYWFLTNSRIHTWISMGTLVVLSSIVAYERWRVAYEFRARLPNLSDFLTQPITAFWQARDAYFIRFLEQSEKAKAKRSMKIDDIQKRNSYRVAHGTLAPDAQGLPPWEGVNDDQRAKITEAMRRPVGVEPGQEFDMNVAGEANMESPINEREGGKRPIKKWLGIW